MRRSRLQGKTTASKGDDESLMATLKLRVSFEGYSFECLFHCLIIITL